MLDDAQLNSFIDNGFVRIENAFPEHLAAEGRAIIWDDIGGDPEDPTTWPRPVATRPDYIGTPFVAAANTPGYTKHSTM